jgi:hypothetical protein
MILRLFWSFSKPSHIFGNGVYVCFQTNCEEQAEFLCDRLSTLRLMGPSGLADSCFQDVKSVKDFAGITRFVTAIRFPRI